MGVKKLELNKIIENEDITTVFQPIVSLKNGRILGYEALSRVPNNSIFKTPTELFEAATEYNMLWELEIICRRKAIKRAVNIPKDKMIFLNVDPLILKDEKFKKGFTIDFLAQYKISPKSIIFEITERTSIKDFQSFNKALTHYREEGFNIAIDDMGAGYSGLKMLCETKPDFVKIDMDLIRDIDEDSYKQNIVKSLVVLCENTNMKLIAEGIETKEELIKIIELGVDFGQGYFLERPSSEIKDLEASKKQLVITWYNNYNNKNYYNKNYIGEISVKLKAFAPSTPTVEIKDFLNSHLFSGACIVENEKPVGFITENLLNNSLATQYGMSVYIKRPISLLMNKYPLIIDFNTPINVVSKVAMSRSNETLYDYIIVTKEEKYHGIVSIKSLLEFASALEINYAKYLNPLTNLPGNVIIEKTLIDLINSEKEHCLLYFDLDNFKAYNDIYGFESGDKILKYTANLIEKSIKRYFKGNSFIGHIGGDDFLCVVEDDIYKCDELCKSIVAEFDRDILNFLDEKDINNGYLKSKDRRGNMETFGFTSVSIGGMYGNMSYFENIHNLSVYASLLKKEAKMIQGSSYILKAV